MLDRHNSEARLIKPLAASGVERDADNVLRLGLGNAAIDSSRRILCDPSQRLGHLGLTVHADAVMWCAVGEWLTMAETPGSRVGDGGGAYGASTRKAAWWEWNIIWCVCVCGVCGGGGVVG